MHLVWVSFGMHAQIVGRKATRSPMPDLNGDCVRPSYRTLLGGNRPTRLAALDLAGRSYSYNVDLGVARSSQQAIRRHSGQKTATLFAHASTAMIA